MTKAEKKSIEKQADALKGKRRIRCISEWEIDTMANLDRKKSLNGKTIRIYSGDGFVPNSYNKGFYTPIDYIERGYINGKKIFSVAQTGAARPYSKGALITVDGRGYNP